MLLERVMRLFSVTNDSDNAPPPERQAHELVWNREIELLGRDEVVRRIAAVSDYRNGRTGPSGFEGWSLQIEQAITQLTHRIANQDER